VKTDKVAVVALGGNAITREGEIDTIAQQFANTRASLGAIVKLIRDGYKLAITHGNGPQVGNALLRVELARGKAPILPLGICVADLQGGMGYMIAQSLQNRLHRERIERSVVTLVSQMIVARNDPALSKPTKFIGQFYTEAEARQRQDESGWSVKKDSDRGWRRVVPSPHPLRLVEGEAIKRLVSEGFIVITAGGGGIPVYIEEDGTYEGIDAVIDKDLGAAVMACDIGASVLLNMTDVEKVALNYGKNSQKDLDRLTVTEAKQYLSDGHFPPGSMGPKIEAAIDFLEKGGKEVVISSIEEGYEAVTGDAGTTIVPE
jgi:carbamate kinase